MKDLLDLKVLASSLINRYRSLYTGNDIELPTEFKKVVIEINGSAIEYNRFSAIVTTKANLNIYLPNQWFFIAAFFTQFYSELKQYKELALSVVPKERLKELNGSNLNSGELSKINALRIGDKSKEYLIKFITDYDWWGGGKTIDRTDYYVSPILNYASLVNVSQTYVAELCAFLAENEKLAELLQEKASSETQKRENSIKQVFHQDNKYTSYFTALRTKPFMLLAGISGTGKSRIVREMAKACWKEGDEEYGKNNPRNFCMVQVKPNWHDSTELMGYVSRLGGEKYVVGPFLRFLAAAIKEPDVPYFLCLDEMNLAPVEQYFAEYLSVIESRKLNPDGTITTDPIVSFEHTNAYESLIDQLFDTPEERKPYKSEGGRQLTIPQNLFVVGTVNMDETTFSFSRKVLDRAMTIEMNEVDLHGGLARMDGNEIGYIAGSIIGKAAEGCDVYEDNRELCDAVLEYLEKVNAILEGTPFKIAYRTRNEFLMYAVNRKTLAPDSQLWQTLDEMTSMKILSRIEGDEERTKKVLDGLKALVEEQIAAAIPPAEEGKPAIKSISATKIDEMLSKLKSTGFTSYWT